MGSRMWNGLSIILFLYSLASFFPLKLNILHFHLLYAIDDSHLFLQGYFSNGFKEQMFLHLYPPSYSWCLSACTGRNALPLSLVNFAYLFDLGCCTVMHDNVTTAVRQNCSLVSSYSISISQLCCWDLKNVFSSWKFPLGSLGKTLNPTQPLPLC